MLPRSAAEAWTRTLFSFSSPIIKRANVRSCVVSFTDTEGIEHSIRVPAESLYEAAIEAMAAFRRGVFAEMTFGQATQLRIRVRAPEEEHVVTVGKVMSWLDRIGSPHEQVKKSRLTERLRK